MTYETMLVQAEMAVLAERQLNNKQRLEAYQTAKVQPYITVSQSTLAVMEHRSLPDGTTLRGKLAVCAPSCFSPMPSGCHASHQTYSTLTVPWHLSCIRWWLIKTEHISMA